MMNSKVVALASIMVLFISCNKLEKYKISNPTKYAANELLVEITDSTIISQANALPFFKLIDNTGEVAYEKIEQNNKIIKILTQLDIPARSENNIFIQEGKPMPVVKKTQAEISVAQGGEWKWVTKNNGNEQWEYQGTKSWKNVNDLINNEKHWDHSFDIRYEGPGWESDKIGYRFYLDWRNAVDIFGKKVNIPILQEVGLDGSDSYHHMSSWGADIMKVGDALGIGSIAHWADNKATRVDSVDSRRVQIVSNGKLQSRIKTTYRGWEYAGGKTNLISELTINAGSYLTKCHLVSSNAIDNFATGIIKMPNTEVIEGGNDQWGYFGTFGVQSLNNDELGLLILYRRSECAEITEDSLNHVVVLKPKNGTEVTYYFGGLWALDQSKIKTKTDLETYANKQIAFLTNGLTQ